MHNDNEIENDRGFVSIEINYTLLGLFNARE